MNTSGTSVAIRDALLDIIQGRTVKRSRHDLRLASGDLSEVFQELLTQNGFSPCTVGDVEVRPGNRIPAFYLHDGMADFGWVFWEKFTDSRMRKLFGSIAKNSRGDWDIQLSSTHRAVIYANPAFSVEMDIDRPSGI